MIRVTLKMVRFFKHSKHNDRCHEKSQFDKPYSLDSRTGILKTFLFCESTIDISTSH